MPYVTVTYSTDTDLVYYRFPEKRVAYRWHHDVTLTKAWASDCVQAAKGMKWSDDEIEKSIRTWFSKVQKMSDRYGRNMIPPDIVRAVNANNNMLRAMGKEATAFVSAGQTKCPEQSGCKVLVKMRLIDVKLGRIRL